MKKLMMIACVAALASPSAFAKKQPPQEAFDACSGLSEGDACTVVTPRGEKNGTCSLPPFDGASLACKPEGKGKKKGDKSGGENPERKGPPSESSY